MKTNPTNTESVTLSPLKMGEEREGMAIKQESIQTLKKQTLHALRAYRDLPKETASKIAEITGSDERRLQRHATGLLLKFAQMIENTGETFPPKGFKVRAEEHLHEELLKIASDHQVVSSVPTTTQHKTSTNIQILTREEELNYARAWRDHKDGAAREKLLLAYRPLALTIAQRMARTNNLALEDLAQEAYLEMARRFDSFDPERGFGFGTFVRRHVQGCLNRYAMDTIGPVRTVLNANDKRAWFRFRKQRAIWESKHRRPLTDEGRAEIAELINVPLKVLLRFEARISGGDISMDDPISDTDGTTTRGSLIPDHGPSPETSTQENFDRQRLTIILAEMIQELPERERDVLRARFNPKRVEFAELGAKMGITKERVRQIEQRGLERIRKSLEERGMRLQDLPIT